MSRGNLLYSTMRSGTKFYPLDPHADDIKIDDIAWGLSRINRYLGHTYGEPYNVGQHCILGSYYSRYPLQFLLHDSEETYYGDVTYPNKYSGLCDMLLVMSKKTNQIVMNKYGLEWNDEIKAEVKHIDLLMLTAENRDLRNSDCHLPNNETDIIEKIIPWPWEYTYNRYLERFKELTFEKVNKELQTIEPEDVGQFNFEQFFDVK